LLSARTIRIRAPGLPGLLPGRPVVERAREAALPGVKPGGPRMPESLARTVCLSLALLVALLAGGCAAMEDRSDYHRHSMSELKEDWRRPGTLLFEATTSSLYPADSEEAEAVRMEWLAGWMKRSGQCPAGWEILSREPIDPGEMHARRRDLRYALRCAGTPDLEMR
jgi:hypothetical protein